MAYIAGVDEAGRGPIIGPLVICVAAIHSDNEKTLKELGVKDSKLLTDDQRKEIYDQLINIIEYEIIVLDPATIDSAVSSNATNLNWLEADYGARILDRLHQKIGKNISKCVVDCPSPNLDAYKRYFKGKMKENVELVMEHKADFNHLVVGAASIIAKETRERMLEKIKVTLNIEFGSGYPSDPRTKEFISKNHSNPQYSFIFRKSWETYKKLVREKEQASLGNW